MTAPTPIRVFLLDDHEIVRRGLRTLLEAEDDIEVVGEAGLVADAIPAILRLRPVQGPRRADRDQCVQRRPRRAEDPAGWLPRRLVEADVPARGHVGDDPTRHRRRHHCASGDGEVSPHEWICARGRVALHTLTPSRPRTTATSRLTTISTE